MTIGKKVKEILNKGTFVSAKNKIKMTPGEMVRTVRELQGLSQNALAKLTDLPQSTISGIEKGRINLGVERTKILARALRVHPSVLLFPHWEVEDAAA